MIVKNLLFKTVGAQTSVSGFNQMMMFNPGAMRFFAAAAVQNQKQVKKAKKHFVDAESVSSTSEVSSSNSDAPKVISLYKPKRSAFLKLGYNENHIPNQGNYEKDRKPKLA